MIKFFIRNFILALNIFLTTSLAKEAYAEQIQISQYDYYPNINSNFFDEEGNKIFLDSYEGNAVLLVFWASWCGSCSNTLPMLDNLQKDFRKLPFRVLAVSEDYHGVEKIKQYYKANDIKHLKIFHDYQNQLFKELEVVSLPTAFLINSDGKIKAMFKGITSWNDDNIRKIILDEMDNNTEMPRNSYVSPVIHTSSKPKKNDNVNNNNREKTDAKASQ
ncbi:TlpA disulfide reductase family protein [Rickettsiaceae bacterium]|nr:TlpA disulfide reductase family protein [Rickettsiaceae bacterium]